MISIVSYQKVITPVTTYTLRVPDNAGVDDATRCTELATLGDVTYVAIPAGVTLPEQPTQITVTPVTLTDSLKEQIKAASPHVSLIAERMLQKIRAAYTPEDEMYFARISIGVLSGQYVFETGEQAAVAAYGAHVEGVREWGRTQRAALGL